MINPEKSLHEVVNDGGILWVMGCKTEEEGTAFEAQNGVTKFLKMEDLPLCYNGSIMIPLYVGKNSK